MSKPNIRPLPIGKFEQWQDYQRRIASDPVDWQAKETLGVPLRSNLLARREAERQLYRMAHALFWFMAGSVATVIAVLLMRG